jgi:hypothetical protein
VEISSLRRRVSAREAIEGKEYVATSPSDAVTFRSAACWTSQERQEEGKLRKAKGPRKDLIWLLLAVSESWERRREKKVDGLLPRVVR